jgi:hypothetical protein
MTTERMPSRMTIMLLPAHCYPAINPAPTYNMYKQFTKRAPAPNFGPPGVLTLFLNIIHGRMSSINILQSLRTISPIKIHREFDGCAQLHLDDIDYISMVIQKQLCASIKFPTDFDGGNSPEALSYIYRTHPTRFYF